MLNRGLYHDGHMVYHDGHNATAMKTNGVLLRNRQIHGEFTVILSSENMFVAVMVVAIMVFVCGHHGLLASLSNPVKQAVLHGFLHL